MKILSYVALIAAGISLLLALLAHFFFNDRIIFYFTYYISGAGLFLLTSIAFALHHLINMKSK